MTDTAQHSYGSIVLSSRGSVRARFSCAAAACADRFAQSAGQLKVFPAGFQWRKGGGGKDVSVAKDGAPRVRSLQLVCATLAHRVV